MKRKFILPILLFVALSGCQDSSTDKSLIKSITEDEIIIDQKKFEDSWNAIQAEDPVSDPFVLTGLSNDSTVLNIEVAYSGGCQEHSFELIWPEVITMIYPPRYTVILNHDAHDDLCEAYLSQTLYFDLSNEGLGLTVEDMKVIDLTIINGSNGEEFLKLNH